MQHRYALKQELEAGLKRKTRMEWTALMIEGGIPAGPINTLEDVFADAQVQACGLVRSLTHPVLGELRQVDLPLGLSGAQAPSRRAPPVFGQHTREVFARYGMADAEIDRLLAEGVAHQAETCT
jgi:crotonobetainyl-CoA:carnitine CoA-transferase CaiB-like acyl-CoA transferase